MSSRVFLYIYLGGIVLRPLIRLPAFIKRCRGAIKEDRVDWRERLLMALVFVGMLVCPLLALGPWLLEWVHVLPAWAAWSGGVLYVLATGLLWRAHTDLGRRFSPTVRMREGQRLVTTGIYGWDSTSHLYHPLAVRHRSSPSRSPLDLWLRRSRCLVASLLLSAPARRSHDG